MASNPSAFVATPASIGAAPASAVPWEPPDNALLGAVQDPELFRDSQLLVAGSVYLIKYPVRAAQTVTNAWWTLFTAGVGASTGSFTGVYSSAGVLLSGSADIAANLTGATGPFSVPLTTPQPVAAGSFVWLALLVNLATTQPTMSCLATRGSNTNTGLTAPVLRVAVNGTGQTALPVSITPAANTPAGSFALWAGVS